MIILAIDPGSENSAWLLYDREKQKPCAYGIWPNRHLLKSIVKAIKIEPGIHIHNADRCVCEMVAHYGTGQPAGKTVFQTCIWIGQFMRQWEFMSECKGDFPNNPMAWLMRKKVAAHICGSARANDSQIRQALIDRYGGTKQKAVGTKKNKGPLYGISGDIWSALAIAITYAENLDECEL